MSGAAQARLSAALFSRWLGNEVILLEKAAELGGTTRKAAFWYWVPNNLKMRKLGLADPKSDCLRYMARLSRPEAYDPDHATFGMSPWEFSTYEAIYDNASAATELLAEKGALEYRHYPDVPDYWAELPEDKAPKGRVLLPKGACETMSDGGEVAVRTMSEAARRDGVEIRTGMRVQRLIRSDAVKSSASKLTRPKASPSRFVLARPSYSRPAASRMTSTCGRTFSPRRYSAAAPPSPTRAISSTSGPRSGRSCAT